MIPKLAFEMFIKFHNILYRVVAHHNYTADPQRPPGWDTNNY